jgi:hypothetical protein
MVSAGIINTYIGQGKSVELLETDISNPDVLSLVGDIPMSPIERWGQYVGWQELGNLASASLADVVVLNAKAGDVTAFDCFLHGGSRDHLTAESWAMAKQELADLLDACGRKVIYLHVMRREPINVQLAREVLPFFPDSATKVAVLNGYYGEQRDFVHWHQSDTRKLWLAWGGRELFWPGATDHTMHEVYRLSLEQRLDPANLNSVSDLDVVTGKILLDTTKFLPLANRGAMEKHGANSTLIAALHHYQARITAAVKDLENNINAKKGS